MSRKPRPTGRDRRMTHEQAAVVLRLFRAGFAPGQAIRPHVALPGRTPADVRQRHLLTQLAENGWITRNAGGREVVFVLTQRAIAEANTLIVDVLMPHRVGALR